MRRNNAHSEITLETRHDSFEAVDEREDYKRIKALLKSQNEPMTAHEIARYLFVSGHLKSPHRQEIAPRLTEMSGRGTIVEICKKYDPDTKRNAAAYQLKDWEAEA